MQSLRNPDKSADSHNCVPGYKNEPMLVSFQLVMEIYNQLFSEFLKSCKIRARLDRIQAQKRLN